MSIHRSLDGLKPSHPGSPGSVAIFSICSFCFALCHTQQEEDELLHRRGPKSRPNTPARGLQPAVHAAAGRESAMHPPWPAEAASPAAPDPLPASWGARHGSSRLSSTDAVFMATQLIPKHHTFSLLYSAHLSAPSPGAPSSVHIFATYSETFRLFLSTLNAPPASAHCPAPKPPCFPDNQVCIPICIYLLLPLSRTTPSFVR